MLKVLPEIRI